MTHQTAPLVVLLLATLALDGCKPATGGDTTERPASATRAGPGTIEGATPATASGAEPSPPSGLAFHTGQWAMTTTLTDVAIRSEDPAARAGEQMMRAAIGKAETSTVCIDQASVDRGLANLNQAQAQGSCEPGVKRVADGVIDVAMVCKGRDGSTATVTHEGRYDADSLTSTVVMKAAPPAGRRPAGEGLDMTISNTGRRLGDCPASKDAP